MIRYYRRDSDGALSLRDSGDGYESSLIAAGYSRIGRKAWREYKREQKNRVTLVSGVVLDSVGNIKLVATETVDANAVLMSEEPYL